MGKYSKANETRVKNRYVTDGLGTHLVEVASFRDGKSFDGKDWFAMELKVLQSDTFSEGETVSDVTTKRSHAGAEEHFMQDIMRMVGPAQGKGDASEVTEEDIESALGEKSVGVGTILRVDVTERTYTNRRGETKTIKKASYTFVGFTLEEALEQMGGDAA